MRRNQQRRAYLTTMTTDRIITSQDFLSDEIVEAKQAAKDYEVLVSPEFEFEGQTFRVLLDGHHSFAAALLDGVEPEMVEATAQVHDAVGLLQQGKVDLFLEVTHMGSDYRYAATKTYVW